MIDQIAKPKNATRPMAVGPTVLITGAERGIGLAFVASLVDAPDVTHIFAACYNVPEKAQVSEGEAIMTRG